MPNFDLDRYFMARSEQEHWIARKAKAQLTQRDTKRQREDIEQETLLFEDLAPEDQRFYRLLQFARHLVQEGKLSEWTDCCQVAGIARLAALEEAMSSSSASPGGTEFTDSVTPD